MDSSSAIARYIPQKSKKRVFPGGSSGGGSGGMEPEVIDIGEGGDQSPKSESKAKDKGKGKEVAYHEIIDVDMDEDRNDVVFIEGKVESNKKMKRNKGISLGSGSGSQSDSKNRKEGGRHSSMSFTPGSNNFFDLDDYVYDDEYFSLQSHFDNMDLPTGVEAPIPWLPDLMKSKKKSPADSLFTSNPQIPTSQLNMVDPLSSSTFAKFNPDFQSGSTHASAYFDAMAQINGSNFTSPGSDNFLPNSFLGQVGDSKRHKPSKKNHLGLGQVGDSKRHKPSKKNHLGLNDAYLGHMLSDSGDLYSMDDPLSGQDAGTTAGPTSSSVVGNSSSMGKFGNDELMKRYESFKRFDTVADHSDHYYTNQKMSQPEKNWAKKIQGEWKILEKDLPDTIFVRAYESRMDLLRAVIIGAEGTPYHDGLFFFDVCFPARYPQTPPLVHYHSGGLRINPNLYNCGKVCLSLLNTWTGGKNEKWIPGSSTMLQVLVSIQGLILNTKPYFNEPGYAHSSGSVQGEKMALNYNENTLILSLRTMVYTMKKQPKYFEDLVVGHFRHRVRDILMACKAYTEGVQIGSLMRGGVQDVDEDEESCSYKFKTDVVSYIKVLIDAFKKVGAKEAEEFHFISEKKIPAPKNNPVAAMSTHAYGYGGYNPALYLPNQPPITSFPKPLGTYIPNPPGAFITKPPGAYPNPHTFNPKPPGAYNPHTYNPKPSVTYDSKPPTSYSHQWKKEKK